MSAKKRILIFSTAYFPFVGGAEVAMKEITDRVHEYEFDMVTAWMDRSIPRVEQVGNITVHRIGIGIPMVDKLYLALLGHKKGLALHKDREYALVWSLMASYCAFAALSWKKHTGVPFLLTLQEGDPIDYILKRTRFVKKRFTSIFTSADGLQAISTYLLNWGKDMGFSGKIEEVVPNGVDVARFTAPLSDEQRQHIRQEIGFPAGSTIVVTASRLVIKNGVEDVIRALPHLPEEVCFAICGTGELQEQLEQVVRDLGVGSRVRFLGNKSHDELPKILHASDMFIRPSLTEGLGNAFLEAMAAGLPTIGTMVGGIPDFLEDGKTGFVCDVQDPKSVADTVTRIMALSDDEKQQIHERAMAVIEDRYNWTYIVARMNHFFTTLCTS